MDIILDIVKEYGVQSIGWGIALVLAYKFVGKWDSNITQLTKNVTELTTIVKVQQEQLDNIKEDVGALQSHVFPVKYKRDGR